MNAKTLKALKGSIAKWEDVVAKKTKDEGAKNCPLCQLLYRSNCKGCPVVDSGRGRIFCRNTPHRKWLIYTAPRCVGNSRVFDDRSRRLAQAELDFLKSLLPGPVKCQTVRSKKR